MLADEDDLSAMVRVNCESTVRLTRHFLPSVLAHQGGVLHVASVAGLQPMPYVAVYGGTKAFVIDFCLALAADPRRRS